MGCTLPSCPCAEVTAWLTSPSAADQLCSGRNVCGNSNALALSQVGRSTQMCYSLLNS